MQKLKEHLLRADVKDEYTNKCIYSYVKDSILPNVDAGNECPPLSVLIYTAQLHIEPKISHDEIPDLLELLAHIEDCRLRAVEHALKALHAQVEYVARQESRVRLLKKSDENKLWAAADVERCEDVRQVLRNDIMLNLCRMHICYLWTSPESHTIARTMRRYFPSNYTKDTDPFADERWNDLIHHGLTSTEREDVHRVGESMKAFLLKARAWDMERKTYFEKHGLPEDEIFGEGDFLSYSRDFNAKFQGDVDERLVHECISRYLTEVQRLVTLVERLFPNDQQDAVMGAECRVEMQHRMRRVP